MSISWLAPFCPAGEEGYSTGCLSRKCEEETDGGDYGVTWDE